MASNLASEIASTIQSATIKRDPSPDHDINPATIASDKTEAQIQPRARRADVDRSHHHASSSQSRSRNGSQSITSSDFVDVASRNTNDVTSRHRDEEEEEEEAEEMDRDRDRDWVKRQTQTHPSSIHLTAHPGKNSSNQKDLPPSSSLTSPRRVKSPYNSRAHHPPLPDLRFEQSYLSSIAKYLPPDQNGNPDKNTTTAAATAGKEDIKIKFYRYSAIALITLRDQMLMPLVQGIGWNLLLFGWRNWNRQASFAGGGIGARIRRWWWGVNGWGIPGEAK